mmetsp:Transcript_5475/g.12109  ORF Transcript_5475/g.12109 Transcript_5475/m.12109 type:complete len:162 (-) Transcript_5475:1527-2012(-)
MAGMIDKVKVAVGLQEQQEKSLISTVDEWVSLTWKQRLIGFGVCIGIGFLLSIASLPLLWTMNIPAFAVMYSLGAIVSICSTMFLMGPCKQLARMLDGHRILATIVYFAAIIGTLVVAFKTKNAGLCLICIVIQFLALCWYCLTWIPGGQAALKAMIFRGG